MECYSQRTNLIIEGVPENGEDEFKVVCSLLSDKLNCHDVSAIDLSHRMGKMHNCRGGTGWDSQTSTNHCKVLQILSPNESL